MAVTSAPSPYMARILNAVSMAYRSKGFIFAGTPSRFSVPVVSSISTCVVPGTCLIQTSILITAHYTKNPPMRGALRAL